MRNYIVFFFILTYLTVSSQSCADKLFLNIDFKKSSQEICKQLNKDTNFIVLNTYKQFDKGWEGLIARYKKTDPVYPGADSIYVDIGWGHIKDAPNSLNRLTKSITMTVYLKNQKAADKLLLSLKSKICRDVDFDNQPAIIEEGRVAYGDVDTHFLSQGFYPNVMFLKRYAQQKNSVLVLYNDFE